MSISDGIALLGGIALFLFGMSLMGDGLKRVAGNKLELILYQLSSTPIRGILLGTGVTAVIQSSSATSVMVVGFVNSGMMKVRQAIGIVLGAILGTSVTGWVLCLSNLSGDYKKLREELMSKGKFLRPTPRTRAAQLKPVAQTEAPAEDEVAAVEEELVEFDPAPAAQAPEAQEPATAE